MRKLLMTVYNDIRNDARVIRAAKALAEKYELYLYAVNTVDITGVTCIAADGIETIGGVSAYLRYIFGLLRTAKKLHPDLIYGHDIFSAVPLNILQRTRRNCRYIYDAHELFAIEPGRKYSLIEKLQYYAEDWAIRHAALTICAEKRRGEYMVHYHKLEQPPLVIQNISYLPEGEADAFFKDNADFFSVDAFGVVYAGGLLPGRKLEMLISAVSQLGKKYKLMLIGNGPARASLETQIRQCNHPNIRLCAAVPYQSLRAILSQFDIGYLYYSTDSLNNLYCAPNKIYEYASVGLPVLANENPTVSEIISSAGIGICDNEISRGLKKLIECYDYCCGNINAFLSENSVDMEMEKLRHAIDAL